MKFFGGRNTKAKFTNWKLLRFFYLIKMWMSRGQHTVFIFQCQTGFIVLCTKWNWFESNMFEFYLATKLSSLFQNIINFSLIPSKWQKEFWFDLQSPATLSLSNKENWQFHYVQDTGTGQYALSLSLAYTAQVLAIIFQTLPLL